MKSAYQLAYATRQSNSMKAESSKAGGERKKMWRRVWQLPVKPKLKHFLWKCLHNWLAIGKAIKRRGLHIDEVCHRCGMEIETREHLLFQCQESKLIWKHAPVCWEGIHDLTVSFEEWWKAICLAKSDPNLQKRVELTAYILWHIWKSRCLW